MLKSVLRACLLGAFVPIGATLGGAITTHAAPPCTPTGFVRDSINLTAGMIDPVGPVRGTVDATGCNIGIYFGPGSKGTVDHATVFGSNYYGVVNDGAAVDVTHSTIYDIGENPILTNPLHGDQHGVAIYFAYHPSTTVETGAVSHDTIYNYQKGGIVINGPGASATVDHNIVQGFGPVNFIAQNGIQFGFGSTGAADHNDVSGNSYTGPGATSSAGILIFGGCGAPTTNNVAVNHNQLTGNDVGIYFSNFDPSCLSPSPSPTNDVASHNTITNDAVNNTTGNGTTPYQAGITDVGNTDTLDHNEISGAGYASSPPNLFCIDDTFTTNVQESHNDCS